MMIFDKFLVNESFFSVCVPCRISMLNKMMFAKLLILCSNVTYFCALEDKQIFSLNNSIIFKLLHNPTFVKADDNDNDI